MFCPGQSYRTRRDERTLDFLHRHHRVPNIRAVTPNIHPFYVHSGKFGIHGPLLAIGGGALIALPLGLAYGYLIRWIPFIYLNFLITLGYGFAFGWLTSQIMKIGKVRNGAIAMICGTCVGVIAWYGNWNGSIHALASEVPWVLTPPQVLAAMKALLKEGSWSIGRSSDLMVTGIPLAIVWIVEAAMIIGVCALVSYGSIASNPFCEIHGCWLDEEKVMDKLDVFTHPDHIAAFSNGDISPLEEARARVPASGQFARLTLKHSRKCSDYCALTISNVTVTVDKDGKPDEEVQDLMTNLWVPRTMFDYLAQFDRPTAKITPGV